MMQNQKAEILNEIKLLKYKYPKNRHPSYWVKNS